MFPGTVLLAQHENEQRPALILANQAREASIYYAHCVLQQVMCALELGSPSPLLHLQERKANVLHFEYILGELTEPPPLRVSAEQQGGNGLVSGKKWISEITVS